MAGRGAFQWRHDRECQVGDCDREAVVDVAIQLRNPLVPLGSGVRACGEHAGDAATLLLLEQRERLTDAVVTLEGVPDGP